MATLDWGEDNDFTVCGNFAIQTERVRHEGTYHEVWCLTPAAKAAAKKLDIDRGTSSGKRTARRIAQRIANAMEET